MKNRPVHTVIIQEIYRGIYEVSHEGQVLVAQSRDPEWDAARALVSLGYKGQLQVKRYGSNILSFNLPLKHAAQLVTNGTDGFRAFEPAAVANLRCKIAS